MAMLKCNLEVLKACENEPYCILCYNFVKVATYARDMSCFIASLKNFMNCIFLCFYFNNSFFVHFREREQCD